LDDQDNLDRQDVVGIIDTASQKSTSTPDSVTTALLPESNLVASKSDSAAVQVSADEELLEQMLGQESPKDPSIPADDQPLPTDSGEPLLRDDGLRLRTARTGELERNLDDDDAILRRRSREGEDVGAQNLPASDSTEADPEIVTTPQPAARATVGPAPLKKPDWIKPEYFINVVIPQPLTLHALLASIETNFQGTRYGDRASVLKRGLIAHRDEVYAPPDTTTQAVEPGALGATTAGGVSDTTLVSLDR
jgi:hypothetical protein